MNKGNLDNKVIYPELSYTITGVLFYVQNTLGVGHKEKYYEEAVAQELAKRGVLFTRQFYVPVIYEGKNIGKYYFDFLVDNKIVVELKVGNHFSPQSIEQTYRYLRVSDLRLGILARFSHDGVKIKRVLNAG